MYKNNLTELSVFNCRYSVFFDIPNTDIGIGIRFKSIEHLFLFTARCTLVQSAVLRLHVVCLSVCLCNVGEL